MTTDRDRELIAHARKVLSRLAALNNDMLRGNAAWRGENR